MRSQPPIRSTMRFCRRTYSILNQGRSVWLVNGKNGFLPTQDPLFSLPKRFAALEELLEEMPVTKTDGTKGLLGRNELGNASAYVPKYNVNNIEDPQLLSALFRDYTFWASAYLLEPCHHNLMKTGKYGLGREVLPSNIAVPLNAIANKLGMKPFMEYATSYALYNWKRNDPQREIEYDNLSLIRKLSGLPSESGFILVHVAMVAHSGRLVQSVKDALKAYKSTFRTLFNEALCKMRNALNDINNEMETMWTRSDPNDYKNFRTFIMGTKSQPMFPNGVLYEGVSKEPFQLRGESGANDSIIPTMDNFFQIYDQMPANPLTEILHDFRTYRPKTHNQWLSNLHKQVCQLQLRPYMMANGESALLTLECIDYVREFRQRHWNFTKEYIIKHSTHPVATGGSPIATWLPNQLSTVLSLMDQLVDEVEKRGYYASYGERQRMRFDIVKKHLDSQQRILSREVAQIQQKIEGVKQ